MAKKLITKSLSSQYAEPVEWTDEPTLACFSMGKPAVVQAVRPTQPVAKKYLGNATKKHCIIERATKRVVYTGSMADCQAKLQAKRSPMYAMRLCPSQS